VLPIYILTDTKTLDVDDVGVIVTDMSAISTKLLDEVVAVMAETVVDWT
jgi:hypothetical protein